MAPARQKTLQAALDWSYHLLSDVERAVLRRLAVFGGAFTLAAAAEVAHGAEVAPAEVAERVAALVAKSLVGVEADGGAVLYRLLGTTRSYALDKLRAAGEDVITAQRLALRRPGATAPAMPCEQGPA
jgi:predicted ATPase